MITPNKLNYGTCPHCKTLLNCLDWIPLDALGACNYQFAECPSCQTTIVVRVHVTFDIQVEKV